MRRLISADLGAKRHRQPVPAVDRDHREGQGEQLVFAELRAHTVPEFVGGLDRAKMPAQFVPEGAFKADLRAAGYDADNPEPRYPTSVLLASLDVIARHVYPELSREEAHRKIGQRFSDRYLTTIIGRIIRTLVLALGVDRFVMQMPKIVALSSTGDRKSVV